MNKKINFFIIFFIMLSNLVFGHNPEVIKIEKTKIKVQFDTGEPMFGARLIIESKDGKKIYTGFVKENGIFDYKDYLENGYKIIVNDGGDHSIEFIIPKESSKE